MAYYAVSKDEQDWEGTERFNYKSEAEDRFQQIASAGQFVRLIVWNDHEATELEAGECAGAIARPLSARG